MELGELLWDEMRKKLITWADNYIIDKGLIDGQHQKLINLINNLHSAFLEGKANDHLNEIVEELAAYTKYHFQSEEDIFCKTEYPEKEQHKKQHRDFIEKIEEFKNKLIIGDSSLSFDIMLFLQKWLQNHILISDKEYKDFI